MNHNYRLERKTVTASLGILALSLGILSNVSAADIKAGPGTNLEQLAQSEEDVTPAHEEAMASSMTSAVKPQTFKLPGGFKLKIKSLKIKKIGKLELQVNLNGQIKKKNPVPVPGNKYISASGKIGVRFGVKTEGGQLCTAGVSITSVNFKNVQNDVEQAAKEAINEFFAAHSICVPIKV